MTLPGAPATVPRTIELLDRAVGYARICLARVGEADLDRPTPCAQWSLRDLLVHMDDSLAALGEAAGATRLSLVPVAGDGEAAELLGRVRQRACSLVAQWVPAQDGPVALGQAWLAREVLGGVGALEITLHGWDVGRSVGADLPIPAVLALDLWPWARDHITDADRPARFGEPPAVSWSASPPAHLLARAGRREAAVATP
ncbi:maleylpyruvate isomerase N-terminal domain-containing protein [Pedococcus sp. 2YAF34]|uniref:maleylpyruvate isomerase N-terminal domain-containing protein n=1 Tax=Pedococcus sp. 2YAF34 TaxID=3233032 RepID=UPI003F99D260